MRNPILEYQQSIPEENINDEVCMVGQKIFKLLMGQISSLKDLHILWKDSYINTLVINHPRAKDSLLRNLSKLHCDSKTDSKLICQLSQIVHNLRLLTIIFHNNKNFNELIDLISAQKNLKRLNHLCLL